MTAAILSALASHWRRNPMQLMTLLAGLALATALWSGVQAINAEARASYDAAAATLGEGQFAQITARDGGAIPQATYVALRRVGWAVSPVIEGRLEGVRLIGLEPLTAPGGLGPVRLDEGADLGAFLSGEGQILARTETLARLSDTGAQKVPSPDVAPNTALTDIGLAQRLLGRAGEIDRLIVANVQPLTRASLAQVAPELVESPPPEGGDVARLTDSFHLNLTAFGLLSFAVGLFIVHGAIGLAFEQRRPMVRTLRALGAPLRRLIALMAVELAVLALIAGLIGVGLGYVIAAALLPDVAATLRGLYGADVAGQLSLRPAWWLSGLAIAMGGTAVAAGGALWSLARMPLLSGAHPRAWAMGRQSRSQAVAALALLGLAGTLAVWGEGLMAGFTMLGALLIGGALALPPLLTQVLRWAERLSQAPMAQWFWADTRQQVPGLSLALMALLLAMAANVGVSTMVSSFRLTFTGFLDQRLASELYVTAADTAQAEAIIAVAARDADAILPLLSAEVTLAGLPAQIYGARDHATYRENWQFLQAVPAVWDVLARGEGVLVNEQLYRRAGLDLGMMVPVGAGLTLPVLGVYGDYGNPIGQVIVTEDLFRSQFPQITALRFGLRSDPERVESLRVSLRNEADLPDTAMVDQAALKAMSLAVFERTFTVTTALNVLTLAVAGFAILMSLLTLAAMRLPQLAPVWALGLTRRRLAGLDLVRAIVLAALTGALALPLGLALAWALLAVVNVEAFGWRLPMYLFPLDYLRLGALALVAAALAALWPAWRLSHTPPAQLLGVFRHER
ncbi:FtsX-like permease family protein [Seohaeicola sp. SP36]|uniref:FtsX-like permease family protein n=1 Tax=unclassified Seohaeicola TaxID=2641111 RepID=UPI00237BFF0B|nr:MULTISPECIES: FtsX-like permease family protein [unclassified Seohaeicola]MDD9705785.1 FtsX-like permease family protein [Seohaeicola sp. 4SK31]MDD9735296.1 FtsX-like permease family protein [Seohaeicola sp. SP36]